MNPADSHENSAPSPRPPFTASRSMLVKKLEERDTLIDSIAQQAVADVRRAPSSGAACTAKDKLEGQQSDHDNIASSNVSADEQASNEKHIWRLRSEIDVLNEDIADMFVRLKSMNLLLVAEDDTNNVENTSEDFSGTKTCAVATKLGSDKELSNTRKFQFAGMHLLEESSSQRRSIVYETYDTCSTDTEDSIEVYKRRMATKDRRRASKLINGEGISKGKRRPSCE